jgi:lipoprotein-releasing system permease protein
VFPSDIYLFDRIPSEVHMPDVLTIVGFALIVAVVAGFYPAHRAANLNPVEALRYE